MPGRASSCSAVARLMSSGPAAVVGGAGPGGAAAARRCPHDRHVDLRPVEQRRGEVDGGQVGVGRRATGGLERGVHPCAHRQLVHAGAHHGPGNVDDEVARRRRRGGRATSHHRIGRGRRAARRRPGRRGGAGQPGLRRRCRRPQEPPSAGHHGDHRDADGDQSTQPEPVDPRPAAGCPSGDPWSRRIGTVQLDRCRIERVGLVPFGRPTGADWVHDTHEILLASARRGALRMRGMSVSVTLPEGCQNNWAVSLRRNSAVRGSSGPISSRMSTNSWRASSSSFTRASKPLSVAS